MNVAKEEMRRQILALRESMSNTEALEKSRLILKRLMDIKKLQTYNIIMCYTDFRNEVSTKELIRDNLAAGKKVVLPVIQQGMPGGKRYIVPCQIQNIDEDLVKGFYGISEPVYTAEKYLEPEKIDIIIVPGVAFDRNRYRVGYGGGYYDRFLLKARGDCMKIGLAYEFQIVDNIPVDDSDIRLDMVVTEKRII